MKIELFGNDISLLCRWEQALAGYRVDLVDGISDREEEAVVVADFDSVRKGVIEYLKRDRSGSGVRLVVLQSAPSVRTAEHLLAADVKGYGNSYMQKVHLLSCVETVGSGNIWLFPEFVYSLVSRLGTERGAETGAEPFFFKSLSDREKELYRHMLDGKSNGEIADAMGITVRTVKAHIGKIYEKAGVRNRIELLLGCRGR